MERGPSVIGTPKLGWNKVARVPCLLTIYFITDVWRTPQILKLTSHTRPPHHKIYNINPDLPPLSQMLPGWIQNDWAPKKRFPTSSTQQRENATHSRPVDASKCICPSVIVKRASPRQGNNMRSKLSSLSLPSLRQKPTNFKTRTCFGRRTQNKLSDHIQTWSHKCKPSDHNT